MRVSNSQSVGSKGIASAGLSTLLRKQFKNNTSLLCPIAYVITTAVFLSIWHSQAIHGFSVRAFAVFVAFCGFALIYGRFFIKLAPLSFKAVHSFSIQFLCGFLIISTVLFLLFLFTPIGMAMSVIIVAGGALLILFFCPKTHRDNRKPAEYLPDFLCLLLSGVAATLWCTDALRPAVYDGSVTIYQTFTDSFFHARVISTVAHAHGLKSTSIIQMSGHAAPFYHYAIYLVPAAVLLLTKSSAYIIVVSFLVPFGILLTGLAAFSLAGSIWGQWPGLAATLAVALLPDAYQQGFGSKWLSYHFFQQAAPGGPYGVACVAIAWMFVLDGCRATRLASILFGWAILVISIVYKAHFFVANAFLLMIYPCIFFRGLRVRWRILSAALLVSLFCFVVSLCQHLDNVPTLRLDGSALRFYAPSVVHGSRASFLKSLYEKLLLNSQPWPIFSLYAASMFLLCTFGFWTAIYLVTSFWRKVRIGAAASLFPLFVILNYLVMSLGLSQDTKWFQGFELVHRPFVWAYFVVAAWSGAGVYVLLFGNGLPANKIARVLSAIIAISSFSVPLVWAHNLQTLPYRGYDSYRAFNSVPSDLIKACLYVRKHSQPKDVIQDSENDPKFWVTGLAERQDFAADCKLWSKIPNPPELRGRLGQLAAFKSMTSESDVIEFAKRSKISWYILRPESKVAWSTAVVANRVYCAGNYRVYHFIP